MVFQSFALFPWLTVLENVEIGLEARGVAGGRAPQARARRHRPDRPRRLRERLSEGAVGRHAPAGRASPARWWCIPKVLLMDEPFSALDVLTAETLRTDLLDLWIEGRMPIKSILMVTHNIEEAVLMCDRILVFSSNPGRIAAEIKVDLPQPRNRLDPGLPPAGRRHLCAHDRAAGRQAGARGRLPGHRHLHGAAARVAQPAGRPVGDGRRQAL